MRSILPAVALLLACSDRAPVSSTHDAGVGRRVFDPPDRKVRAVPPYNIHAGGVGPYKLGASLREVLALHGPRVELLQIDRVVDASLVRTDGDKLVIGAGRTAQVVFISVVAADIAVTDGGLEVGAIRDQVDRTLGPVEDDGIADPRILRYREIPGLRLVVEDNRVTGMMVAAPPGEATVETPRKGAAEPRPPRCTDRQESAAVLVSVARVKQPLRASVARGCFGADAESLVFSGGDLAVVGGEPGRPRRLAATAIADLTFAAGLDVDGDARQEIVAITQTTVLTERIVRLHVLSLEGGRLVPRTREGGEELYRLSSAAATWVGAKLREIELLLEIAATRETLEIGGLYVRRSGAVVRDIAPLQPVSIAVPRSRRRGAAIAEPPPATGVAPTPPEPTAR